MRFVRFVRAARAKRAPRGHIQPTRVANYSTVRWSLTMKPVPPHSAESDWGVRWTTLRGRAHASASVIRDARSISQMSPNDGSR